MIDRYSLPEMKEIWTDEHRFSLWLKVELAVCEVLWRQGKIPDSDWEDIKQRAGFDVDRIGEIEKEVRHDVIAFLTCVAERVGPSSRFIHMGLTSSDILDTAFSLQIQEAGRIITEKLQRLCRVLWERAERYKRVVMVGRTHGIHAEPITLGLRFLSWYAEAKRNLEEWEKVLEQARYGKLSGAVGTYSHISPEVEKEALESLGLMVEPVSTQIVPRDRYSRVINALAHIGACIERIALNVRLLQRTETRELEEPFRKGQKGSSAMPHKRNPIVCERLCGMARLLRGYAGTVMENIALWDERDISHSSVERVVFPDTFLVADYALEKVLEVIKDINVYPEKMEEDLNLTRGLIFSQSLLLALVNKGVSRESAYRMVQECAMRVWENMNTTLKDQVMTHPGIGEYLSKDEIKEIFSLDRLLERVEEVFERVKKGE